MNQRRIRLSVVLAVSSGLIFGLWLLSFQLDVWKHGVAITPRFHIGFFDGGLWVYTDKLPYMGSIRLLSDAEGNTFSGPGGRVHEVSNSHWAMSDYGFGRQIYAVESGEHIGRNIGADLPGIYFRHFKWKGIPIDWTLRVSLWYPIVALAILPVRRAYRWYRQWQKMAIRVGDDASKL